MEICPVVLIDSTIIAKIPLNLNRIQKEKKQVSKNEKGELNLI